MKIRYIAAGLMLIASSLAWGSIGAQRSKAVGELAPYSYPATVAPHAELEFMPDGKSYVERSADGRSLVVKDIATGKEGDVLFDVTHTRETTLPDFEGFMVSPDASKVLVWRNSQSV